MLIAPIIIKTMPTGKPNVSKIESASCPPNAFLRFEFAFFMLLFYCEHAI